MQEIYCFDSTRNKLPFGKSPTSLKKELYKIKPCCYMCGEIFDRHYLELEHKIPVIIGGHLFNIKNLALACCKCHRKKTKVDIAAIRTLRNLKLFHGRGSNSQSLIPLTELHIYYENLFGTIFKMNNKHDNWFNGRVNKDYVQIMTKENRE